ncbi:MAG: TIGR01777 family oxidoreductase [Nocardioidaceae bacterium]
MRFVLAGASGFLGTAWRDHLAQQGHEVVRLVRGEALTPSESSWDPHRGEVDADVVESADVVACLSGAPLAHWPWTSSYKRTFTESRVATTRTLAAAVAASERKPAFLAQSGIAAYGDRADLVLTEDADATAGTFMGRVTQDWERAAHPAGETGARLVVMRTSVVLDRRGGALKPLIPIFKAGLGGPIGPGTQYFSTISLTDWVRAATFLATEESSEGVYNLTAPNPTTNAEFGTALGRALHRPAVVPVPAWTLRKALGEVSSELLSSSRVEPARLLEAGFVFEHPTLEQRITAALAR